MLGSVPSERAAEYLELPEAQRLWRIYAATHGKPGNLRPAKRRQRKAPQEFMSNAVGSFAAIRKVRRRDYEKAIISSGQRFSYGVEPLVSHYEEVALAAPREDDRPPQGYPVKAHCNLISESTFRKHGGSCLATRETVSFAHPPPDDSLEGRKEFEKHEKIAKQSDRWCGSRRENRRRSSLRSAGCPLCRGLPSAPGLFSSNWICESRQANAPL